MRILVVDESALRRALVRQALQSAGGEWDVAEARTVDGVASPRPHVVAAYDAGEGDARVLPELIRLYPDVPVVALVPTTQRAREAFEHGAFDCIEQDVLASAARDATSLWRLVQAVRSAAWLSALSSVATNEARAAALAAAEAPLRVLSVDDSRASLALTRHILKAAGCSVVEAERGEEALELARREKFDVALVDSLLPDMEGIALAGGLASAAPATAVIGLTSSSDVDVERRFFGAGAVGYLGKGKGVYDRLVPALRRGVRLKRLAVAAASGDGARLTRPLDLSEAPRLSELHGHSA